LVIWLFGKTEFGNLGHPKKTGETEFGNNRPKLLGASPKNGISLEGITIFLEKILAKTPNPTFCKVSLHLHLGHSAKNWNLAFSAFFWGNVNSRISRCHHQNWEHCQNRAPNRAQSGLIGPIPIDWVWLGLIGSIAKIRS
jgi:hypothetical protein